MSLLKMLPLRVAVTNHCNLNCLFCSNEGMLPDYKNTKHIDSSLLLHLIDVLVKAGLNSLSLTGGDPTMHPQIEDICNRIAHRNLSKVFFHTNGIELNSYVISKLVNTFSKVAISLHSTEFNLWRETTQGTFVQFSRLLANIQDLAESAHSTGDRCDVEIKCVLVNLLTFRKDNLINLLDLCSNLNVRFKLLLLEAIDNTHLSLKPKINDVLSLLADIGCVQIEPSGIFRGQKTYLPIRQYRYKRTYGNVIEIGCGSPTACESCAFCNEIMVTPDLQLKPCHMTSTTYDLRSMIMNNNIDGILKSIKQSRDYLLSRPGLGLSVWNCLK